MMVFTTPSRREHRNAVAATWGATAADLPGFTVAFAFGRRSGYDALQVSAAEAECRQLTLKTRIGCVWLDAMEVDDSYKNLAFKTRAAVRVAAALRPSPPEWFYKVDDDVYFWPNRLLTRLKWMMSESRSQPGEGPVDIACAEPRRKRVEGASARASASVPARASATASVPASATACARTGSEGWGLVPPMA